MWGNVTILITSADVSEALYALNTQGIVLRDICAVGDLQVRFSVRKEDLDTAKRILRRRGDDIKQLRRSGTYWHLRALIKRPILLVGLFIMAALTLYLPGRVLFVEVEGNRLVDTERIRSAAEECGIRFGASRREVRSEKMKNALLEAIPQLQWAGINTAGCVATISVREKTAGQQMAEDRGAGSIVAITDGIIRQCTVAKGSALCKVGQAVKAGDVLVSGYTDCGRVMMLSRADAEIIAETSRFVSAITPADYIKRGEMSKKEISYSLRVGKIIINFDNHSGISDSTCVKMYEENYMMLPGGFQLPVSLVRETRIYHAFIDFGYQEAPWLEAAAKKYLHSSMIAGQILDGSGTASLEGELIRYTGQYSCLEMIGRVQSEEIIERDEDH